MKRTAICLMSFCAVLSPAARGQGTTASPGTGFVFQLPGPGSTGTEFLGFGYNSNPPAAVIDANGPAGAQLIIAKPDGSKFYVLGSGSGGLQSTDAGFTTFHTLSGLAGNVCMATITPDGRYLLVGSASSCGGSNASTLSIVDTSTDAVVPNTVPVNGSIVGFAVSQDSKTAWMVSNTATGSAVSAINLTTDTRSALLNLPSGGATSIALAPGGLLYVAATHAIYEVNPAAASDGSGCDIALTGRRRCA